MLFFVSLNEGPADHVQYSYLRGGEPALCPGVVGEHAGRLDDERHEQVRHGRQEPGLVQLVAQHVPHEHRKS